MKESLALRSVLAIPFVIFLSTSSRCPLRVYDVYDSYTLWSKQTFAIHRWPVGTWASHQEFTLSLAAGSDYFARGVD